MNKTAIWRRISFTCLDLPLGKVILTVVGLFTPSVYGQIVPSPDDLYHEACEYMIAGEYQEALPVLLNLLQRGHNGANISYRIGESYLNLRGQKIKAIPFLKEAAQKISGSYSGSSLNEGIAPVKSLLYLGIAYRLNYDFANALSSFNAYLEALDGNDTDNHSLAEYHIERCMNAQELIASPAQFRCDTLPGNINSAFSNFNPLVTADEKLLYYMDQLKFYDALMYCTKPDTTWLKPENITPRIKSDGDHVLTGMSLDGASLLLTAYDPYMSGEIFTAEIRNGRWGEMRKLGANINTRFNETHASFSPGGNSLYFTSDRKGGFGGLDIYRSEKDAQGNWGMAENLGPLVNSPYNEESPFLTGDGKALFFSSQGHYNMGGYDIFMSALDNGEWMPPVNIGYPLNTTDDDLFFFPLGTGKVAYSSGMLPNSAQQDIVRYNIISFGNPARYKITGKINQLADPGFEPENLTVSFVDNLTKDTISIQEINRQGMFSQKLPAGSFTLGFSEKDSVFLRRKLDIPVYFPHDELILNTDVTIPRPNRMDTLMVQDILFEFNKSSLNDPFLPYLHKIIVLMTANPGLQLCVNGYADARGDETYNMKLSLMRANAVAGYLSLNTSLAGRIQVKAFGEQNPVASNQNPDGSDNPLGRMYNRRVELVFDHVPDKIVIGRLNNLPVDLRIR